MIQESNAINKQTTPVTNEIQSVGVKAKATNNKIAAIPDVRINEIQDENKEAIPLECHLRKMINITPKSIIAEATIPRIKDISSFVSSILSS